MHNNCHVLLAECYPVHPVVLAHKLASHPLLNHEALAKAARRIRAQDVECKSAKRSIGGAFDNANIKGRPIEDIIRSVATSDCWIMLRFIEQLPEYRALLHEVLGEIEPVITARTGAMRALKAFVFISAPGTVTPFHFDPEYNILFQIKGNKTFATFPPVAPMLTHDAHAALHEKGHNLLPWDESFVPHETRHALNPGDALYVPYKSPHWVTTGSECSISISMTWSSDWSRDQGEAHRCNSGLRKIGFNPRPVPDWPKQSFSKILGGKILRRWRIGV